MGDLTRNFSMDEFLQSDTADRLGIRNTPTPSHEDNIREITAPWMQRLRDRVGRAVFIHSGYRNPELNKAVKGVSTSAHAMGLAGDITVAGMSARALATFIANDHALMSDVDQLILESSRNVVHVSLDPRRRRQILTQAGGPGTQVVAGIV